MVTDQQSPPTPPEEIRITRIPTLSSSVLMEAHVQK